MIARLLGFTKPFGALMAITIAFGGALFGYNTAVISGALFELTGHWGLSTWTESLVASSLLVGAAIGAILGGMLCDAVGRRDLLVATAGIFATGAFVSGLATDWHFLVLGRMGIGLAVGVVSVVVPVYLAEIAPSRHRGRVICLAQVGITVGILIAYVVALLLSETPSSWQGMFMAGAVGAMIFGLCMLYVAGSPRWLALSHDLKESREVLESIGEPEPDSVSREIGSTLEESHFQSWRDLLSREMRLPLLAGIGLFFFQQFAGINAILFYLPTLVGHLFDDGRTETLAVTVIVGAINVLGTFVAFALIDRVGRKKLLVFGMLLMTAGQVLLAGSFLLGPPGNLLRVIVGSFGVLVFVLSFSITIGPIAWVYVGEMFPLRIRGVAAGLVVASHWIFDFVVILSTPALIRHFGASATFGAFALFCIVGAWFCHKLLLETRGLTLEGIEAKLSRQATLKLSDQQDPIPCYLFACVAALGGILFGFDTSIIAGAQLFLEKEWALSASMEGLVVSSVMIGALLGTALAGGFADRFGRRYLILVTAVLFVMGAFGAGLAPSVEWLIFARIVTGIAVGTVSVAVPLYLAEISPASIRGALVSFNHLALVSGVLLAYVVNAAFAEVTDGWRYMFMASTVPALVLGIGTLFLPESPRWLLSRGLEGATRRVLQRLGVDYLDQALGRLKQSLEPSGPEESPWKELGAKWMRIPMFLGIMLMFYQQFTGINFVIYYSPTIFKLSGFESNLAALLPTVGIGVLNLVVTIISMAIVDRVGRRPLFILGLIGVIVSTSLLGVVFIKVELWGSFAPWLVLLCMLGYVAMFALSLGAVCGLLLSEIFPQHVRGVALSVATLANWLFTIASTYSFPPVLKTVGPSITFFAYAAIAFTGFIFAKRFIPETKGRSLEEIEKHWKSGGKPNEL